MPQHANALNPEKAIRELWRRGDLRWKLHDGQSDLFRFIDAIESNQKPRGVMRTARRFGMTYSLGVFAISKCVKRPGVSFPFVAPTVAALKKIVLPQFNEILKDCPSWLRPRYRIQDNEFVFPNRSKILLFGADGGNAERIRGIRADYYVIDEAGFIADLRSLVNDILTPTLMYAKAGFGLISSTPPTSPDHYFVELLSACEPDGAAVRKTIWENPLLDVTYILNQAETLGCVIDWQRYHDEYDLTKLNDVIWGESLITFKSVAFRREMEAECLVDPERAVVPEFSEEKEKRIVRTHRRPERYVPYTVLDTGFIDFTGIVFGYYDFRAGLVVIEDDLLINFSKSGVNIQSLSEEILKKEHQLWGELRPRRFGDGDPIVLYEMSRYGCPVGPVRKDHLEAQVNAYRLDVQQERVVISPRATNVIAHTRYATWNPRRSSFERTTTSGHFDCLAAAIYFIRHVDRQTNPYPENYGVDVFNTSASLKVRGESTHALTSLVKG